MFSTEDENKKKLKLVLTAAPTKADVKDLAGSSIKPEIKELIFPLSKLGLRDSKQFSSHKMFFTESNANSSKISISENFHIKNIANNVV